MQRKSVILPFGLCLAGLWSPSASSQTPLTTVFVATADRPVDLTFAPGDPTRIFIVELPGLVRIVENGSPLVTAFLDIRSIVSPAGDFGLMGLAFHPDYQANGRFFVHYSNLSGNTRVAEYMVSANDPNVANPTRVQFITQVDQPFDNHNGGALNFGGDGMLYLGLGDGGDQFDPNNRAQDPQELLGKMLRFDVDIPAPFVPMDNPFVGNPAVRDEIWLLGLRNPWRWNFDRVTGDLWIGDVGQDEREEVDFIPPTGGGGNLGWRCLDGTFCTGLSGCVCTDPNLTMPIHEYDHSLGCSITGGAVYRGAAIPDLNGTYFFADFCSSAIWSLRYDGSVVSDFTSRTAELNSTPGTLNQIVSFGEDHDGELYILTYVPGNIWRIVPDTAACLVTNYCVANPTSAGPPATISGLGSTSITTNNFTLGADSLPPTTAGIFFYGPAQVQVPSGIGNLCVAGDLTMPAIRMYPAAIADAAGSLIRPLDFTAAQQSMGPGAISPGQTLNFQFWFRDNQMGVPTWNFTNGLSVLFCP